MPYADRWHRIKSANAGLIKHWTQPHLSWVWVFLSQGFENILSFSFPYASCERIHGKNDFQNHVHVRQVH